MKYALSIFALTIGCLYVTAQKQPSPKTLPFFWVKTNYVQYERLAFSQGYNPVSWWKREQTNWPVSVTRVFGVSVTIRQLTRPNTNVWTRVK